MVMADPQTPCGLVLTIDLAALAANWRLLLGRMGAGRDCAAVVKANAYGVGCDHAAPALARAGCRRFFVAQPEEGVALRRVLGAGPEIFILSGPLAGSEALFAAHALIPVLNSGDQVRAWQHQATAAPYALHVDTGMNRLGLPWAEGGGEGLTPCLIMSHLACADEPSHPMNAQQRDRFQAVRQKFPQALASFANSSGLFLGPDYLFDLGRPGVALYGANPTPGSPNPMAAVVHLQARIVQVRRIDTPQTVGYGATRRVEAGTRLATVAAGYADGVLRSLGNQGWGTLGGWRVPMVGRVSMDLITFDISSVPEALAQPDALIDLIGPQHSLEELAAEAGTIPYELLTSLSHRAERRYSSGDHA